MTVSQVMFDPFSDDFFNDPYETYRRMRLEAPVYYNEAYDFYALSRHADVAAGFKDFETYSSARGMYLEMVQSDDPVPPLVIAMDPPDHRRMRSLVNKVFTPRAISALRPTISSQIQVFLDAVNPSDFDAVADFSALFPVDVITAMLGVPTDKRQQIRMWLDQQLEREAGQIGMSEAGMQAGIDTGMMYYNLIQERRAEPRDDMISQLIAAEVPTDDGTATTSLDDIEIAGFASLLGGAGAETVTKLIGSAVVLFAQHPDQWQLLHADRSKIGAAVEELLRYEAPAQYLVRYSMKDIHLHGAVIPAGKPVMLLVGSANRDETAWKDADVFDIDRDRTQAQNIGLGYGIHSCLGAALARLESTIAIDKLLDFMPHYTIDHAGLRRVAMTNVSGWSNVPVSVTP